MDRLLPSNARPNLPLPGAPADRFLGWALPLLSNANSSGDAAEMASLSLHEFLTAGDPSSTERYVPSILRSCQVLLENDGTPLNILRPLLGILTVIASRFNNIFQVHFADIVDLLLGWALMPDLSESDRHLITDSFLHFQNLWAGNLLFSSNLLSKFLGDMEVLAHDAVPGTSNQLGRLWALASCFVAVLQATTKGISESGFKEESLDRFQLLLPRLLTCLGMVGHKFRSFKWVKEATTCLSLFANLFREKFAKFSGLATSFLLETLEFNHHAWQPKGVDNACILCAQCPSLTSLQVQEILKINLELISLQGLALPSDAVSMLFTPGSSFSCLRLHPSRSVTGLVSETYLLLLKHDSQQVVQVATDCLLRELVALKRCLVNTCKAEGVTKPLENQVVSKPLSNLSEREARELIKFDLLLLTCSIYLIHDQGVHVLDKAFSLSKYIQKYLMEFMNPFQVPLQGFADIQLAIVTSLNRLSCLKCTKISKGIDNIPSVEAKNVKHHMCKMAVTNCLSDYGQVLAKGLNSSASFPVKVEVLDWIRNTSGEIIAIDPSISCPVHQQSNHDKVVSARSLCLSEDVVFALLVAASDREHKVRSKVATTLESLLYSNLLHPLYFRDVAEIAVEHLGDTDRTVQNAFRQVLAVVASASLWTIGLTSDLYGHSNLIFGSIHRQWKRYFALRRFSWHLRPQQVLFILNYIAQQSQVLPSLWLQRVIQILPKDMAGAFGDDGKGLSLKQSVGSAKLHHEDRGSPSLDMKMDLLERTCASNTLASAWWAIQETAWHCVTVRLRTHLGGPTQTFGALERMLLDIVQSLQADNSQRDAGGSVGIQNIQLLPMRLLLEFVDALRKNIYNATEGSIVLPTPSPASTHFFRANRKVCEEWFARICEALMNANLALQCYAAAYYHTTSKLYDLRSITLTALRETQWPQAGDGASNVKVKVRQDVLKTLRLASLALCRAHEPSAIQGLQIWANSTFGGLLSDDARLLQAGGSVSGSLGWMSGVALQAQGHYESAAAYFSKLLQSEDARSALGADGVQFIIARTIEIYVALSDWEALEAWLQELQTLRAQHAGKSYAGALTTAGHDMNSIHALACYDAGDVQGAWAHLDLTPQSSGDLTPDPHLALQRSEQMLLQALLHIQGDATENWVKEIEKAKSMLEESLLVSGFDGLTQAAPLLIQLHSIKAFEAHCAVADIREKNSSSPMAMLNFLEQLDCFPLDVSHQDCGLWLKLMRIYKAIMPHFKVTNQIQWHLVRLARKQKNFRLCHRLMTQLCSAVSLDMRSSMGYDVVGDDFSKFDYEFIRLQYAEGNSQEAINGLWKLLQNFITGSKRPQDCMKEMISVACLRLASWIKKSTVLPSSFIQDFNQHQDCSQFPSDCQQDVLGAAVKSAALLSPTMDKAWFAYGTWCFNIAKLSFSGPNVLRYPSLFPETLNSEILPYPCCFNDIEVNAIHCILLSTFNGSGDTIGSNMQADPWKTMGVQVKGSLIESFLQRIVHLMQATAGAVELDGESPSKMLSLQLKQEILGHCPTLNSLQAVSSVNQLMEIWWVLRKRRVCLYEHALEGFVKYLMLSSSKDHRMGITSAGIKQYKHDQTLVSSLYVLHILFNHGVELNDLIRKGISSIPPISWQEVIPQLFSRLSNHPEGLVRAMLVDILTTLAQSFPWAIVYPVLVNINTSEGEPSVEVQQLLSCLLKINPKLVKDVQLLIAELGGITVLWEEQWLNTLQDLHADVIRRISVLKEEALGLMENNAINMSEKLSINASKYSATMFPIVSVLERIIAITSRPPKTAHESWFQEQYLPQLNAAISTFKSPSLHVSSLNDVWRPFDAIAASLASHVKRSVVPLDDVAPKLMFLGSSDVPIPGLEKQSAAGIPGIVTLTAFHKEVQILATKTKPKKLTMIGSDGQTYTYLLKGHEDLRLDARIMQLLRAVNKMLSRNCSAKTRCLFARHYSVTPISGQAGLIQWVDNLVSMYSVFKAWQQRNHSVQFASSVNANVPVPPAIPRPSDMFYGKMLPALKERGLRKVMSRKDWPQEVKRKVLLELMKEIPRQLLHKELLCASDGLTAFNEKLQRFSGTVAVMSMVGYVLGLGDRHLDNILVDFSTGDIVHIDYNVCFEKGLRLKIPEIVPFRLTQTIQAGLGLTGVEGVFRQSCEAVLQTLRNNKDVILMLLGVFAWDPLMEWTKGDRVHYSQLFGEEFKKGMEIVAVDSNVQEYPAQLQVPAAVIGSQEVRSQEVMTASGLAESLRGKEHVNHLTDVGANLNKSLDEHVLSQTEDDCWISPPNSGSTASSAEKEDPSNLESFWLQPTGSLSGSRMWQSPSVGYSNQNCSNTAMPDISTLAIEERNDNTPLLELHSQDDAAFLGAVNADMENLHRSKRMSQIDDGYQISLSPNGLPSQSSNGLLMGDSSGVMGQHEKNQASSQKSQSRYTIKNDDHLHPSPSYTVTDRSWSKKNAYAVSILERIERKLDGLEIEGRRQFTVTEQVDYLLRQAMSIDNLCNMYEGWTPWI